jgi:UDP-N-acetylmuramoylalanine--D-glutamate ligase
VSNLIASSRMIAVVGTGVSGLSTARFLREQNMPFVLFDTRENPPAQDAIAAEFPDVHCEFGVWDEGLLQSADEIVLSPGLPLSMTAIATAHDLGVPVVGDIELFVRHANAPIIAITGSNGKSTVTTLVGEMAKAAGIDVAVGGNLGTPALDLLAQNAQLYVLELSSFQLETVTKLGADVACILNISADHLDRYDGMPAYHRAKQRIYYGAKHVVVNRTDPLTQPPLADDVLRTSFGGGADFKNMGLREQEGKSWLCDGITALVPASALKLPGRHNIDNALAALAIGKAAGFPVDVMLSVLTSFSGLAHRCEWVADVAGVSYYNDSKGTNVGATLAAVNGLAREDGKLVVILGGVAKDQTFAALLPALKTHARSCVLIGQDAQLIASLLDGEVSYQYADSMAQAVAQAQAVAAVGDGVLLSPACASFDMFRDYQARGDAFRQAVGGLQ